MGIFAIVVLVIAVLCAFREKKIVSFYKAIGVFGRAQAYFSMFALIAPVGLVATIVTGELAEAADKGELLPMLIALLIVFVIGVLCLLSILKDCPPELKKRVVLDAWTVGIGVSIKVVLFFMGSIWALSTKKVQDANGNDLFVYGGMVFDQSGHKVGTTNGPDSYIPD